MLLFGNRSWCDVSHKVNEWVSSTLVCARGCFRLEWIKHSTFSHEYWQNAYNWSKNKKTKASTQKLCPFENFSQSGTSLLSFYSRCRLRQCSTTLQVRVPCNFEDIIFRWSNLSIFSRDLNESQNMKILNWNVITLENAFRLVFGLCAYIYFACRLLDLLQKLCLTQTISLNISIGELWQ